MKCAAIFVVLLVVASLSACGEPSSSAAAQAPAAAPATGSGDVIEPGAPPLREFIERDDVSALENAIRQGADVNASYDEHGLTALHLATTYNAASALTALLNAGADPDAPTEAWTPLMNCVAVRNRIALATILLDGGADPNHPGAADHTALMLAAHQGQEDLVTLLLERGADIHATNMYGDTALHEAASNPHRGVHVVALLLAAGADPDATNAVGKTPREIAESKSAGAAFIALLPE